jgi:hypothetical protein
VKAARGWIRHGPSELENERLEWRRESDPYSEADAKVVVALRTPLIPYLSRMTSKDKG